MKNIFGLCIFLFALQAHAQFQIKGQLVENSGKPIENAHIRIVQLQQGTYSGKNGEFIFSEIPEGVYVLQISHSAFATLEYPLVVNGERQIEIALADKMLLSDQVIVEATRADDNTPTTFKDLTREELDKRNFGQDIPVMLDFTPSVVSTSDAGGGIGYTGIRIRGSDATRINVTINGIPVNDSESHGVYWVNTPDLASSVSSIQIQRGVGASTNGAAAFGATINLLTDNLEVAPYAEWHSGLGSFKTLRNTLRFGTGLIRDHWAFDGRISSIQSDGYIDRSHSNLRSYFLSGTYTGNKTTVRLISFAGREETYQSWWGTPQARIENDVAGMNLVADNNGYSQEQRNNLLTSGRTFNYYLYENEVDNYQQDNYQAHFNRKLTDFADLNLALHYTYGRGYYEQYREDEDFLDYDLIPIETTTGTISATDLVRRRWLDNHFFGSTFSLIIEKGMSNVTIGGAINEYRGDHFGEVIWARYAPNIPKDYKYYNNESTKSDMNTYLKWSREMTSALSLYGDIQLRSIGYRATGPDNDRISGVPVLIDVDQSFVFFNPKFGLTYSLPTSDRLYLSYAISNREPVRSDFIDNQNSDIPRPEKLKNIEFGLMVDREKIHFQINGYFMDYKDQLVLTGELNDVGAPIRTNVDRSYRAGIELEGSLLLHKNLKLHANTTLSRNRILSFEEVLYNYGLNYDEYNPELTYYPNTDISFSPALIGMVEAVLTPVKKLDIAVSGKYVGLQYLDNTGDTNRAIPSYFIGFFRAGYSFSIKGMEELNIGFIVNNLFDTTYESNGYTFGYKGGGEEVRENYYYPQAGRNLLFSLALKF